MDGAKQRRMGTDHNVSFMELLEPSRFDPVGESHRALFACFGRELPHD